MNKKDALKKLVELNRLMVEENSPEKFMSEIKDLLKYCYCKMNGCKKESKIKGYCDSHYYNVYWVNVYNQKKCECGRPIKAKGLCEMHYRQQYRANGGA